jgi:hypothetical protein
MLHKIWIDLCQHIDHIILPQNLFIKPLNAIKHNHHQQILALLDIIFQPLQRLLQLLPGLVVDGDADHMVDFDILGPWTKRNLCYFFILTDNCGKFASY